MYTSRAHEERTRASRALWAYEAARGIAALFGGLSGVEENHPFSSEQHLNRADN
jgi:hypothetical protein